MNKIQRFYATAINNTGQVVGNYCSMATTCQSFLDTDGAFTTISFPGASSTIVTGINNSGDMVGYYFQPPPTPEPGTAVLLLSGGLLFGLMMRKRIAHGLQQAN